MESGGHRFAIPQLSVIELVRVNAKSEHRIERIKDTAVLRLRNKLLPLVYLKQLLKIDGGAGGEPDKGFIVVTQVGSQIFGIVVDGVFPYRGNRVKPMSTKLRHITMFSGNTILGDGAVIMIIDPHGIVQAIGASTAVNQDVEDEAEIQRRAANENAISLLVFRAGSPQLKAVPLVLVTRPRRGRCQEDRAVDGRHLVQYRGALMPLVRVNNDVTIRTDGVQPLLVFSDGGRSMALVVDEIVDIVEDRLDIEVVKQHCGCAGLGGDQGPGDRDTRRRPLPAACVRGLVPAQGYESRREGARAAVRR